LLPVDEGEFRQLDTQPRGTLHAAGFFRFGHMTIDGLSSLSYDNAIDNHRLSQRRSESIANLIPVGG
jgi:hypothetical protein